MKVDDWQARDRLIAALEAKGDHRTRAEDLQLARLIDARDQFWPRIPAMIQRHRVAAERLASYAAGHRVMV